MSIDIPIKYKKIFLYSLFPPMFDTILPSRYRIRLAQAMVTIGFLLSCCIGIFEAMVIDTYIITREKPKIESSTSNLTDDQILLLRISPVFSVVTGWIIFFLAMLLCRTALSQKLILLFIFGTIIGSIVSIFLSEYMIDRARSQSNLVQPKIE